MCRKVAELFDKPEMLKVIKNVKQKNRSKRCYPVRTFSTINTQFPCLKKEWPKIN